MDDMRKAESFSETTAAIPCLVPPSSPIHANASSMNAALRKIDTLSNVVTSGMETTPEEHSEHWTVDTAALALLLIRG